MDPLYQIRLKLQCIKSKIVENVIAIMEIKVYNVVILKTKRERYGK